MKGIRQMGMYYSYDELVSTTKTRDEVAGEYKVHRKTLYRRLKKRKVDVDTGTLFPHSLIKIYNALGFPRVLKKRSRVRK